jgi:hypothetical protein
VLSRRRGGTAAPMVRCRRLSPLACLPRRVGETETANNRTCAATTSAQAPRDGLRATASPVVMRDQDDGSQRFRGEAPSIRRRMRVRREASFRSNSKEVAASRTRLNFHVARSTKSSMAFVAFLKLSLGHRRVFRAGCCEMWSGAAPTAATAQIHPIVPPCGPRRGHIGEK